MPLDPKKKVKGEAGPPTYQQENSLRAIDAAFADVAKVLTYVGGNSGEMKPIINQVEYALNSAKKWVLEN